MYYVNNGFSCGSVVKNPLANAGDVSLIPGLGGSPGEENGNPLQCSCLENPRDGEDWPAAVFGVTQSRTRLKRLSSSSIPTPSPHPVCRKIIFHKTSLWYQKKSRSTASDILYELERRVPSAWHSWLASDLPQDMVGGRRHRPSAALFPGRQI